MMTSWTRVSFQRGGVVLAAVALLCVLPSLTGCTNGAGSRSANGSSSKAAVGPANPGRTDHGDGDDAARKTKDVALASAVLPVAARDGTAPTEAAVATMKIPLVKGLTVIGAASERQGDYEASTARSGECGCGSPCRPPRRRQNIETMSGAMCRMEQNELGDHAIVEQSEFLLTLNGGYVDSLPHRGFDQEQIRR